MEDPNVIPELQNRATKAPGVMPKNAQNWAFAAVAVVMILVIAFSSSGNTPVQPKVNPVSQQNPPKATVDFFRAQVDEEARKLGEERAKATRSIAEARAAGIPLSDHEAAQYAGQHVPAERQGPTPEEQQRLAAEAARKKREADSLFASNIALSYRKDLPGQTPLPPSMEGLAKQLHEISQGKLAGITPPSAPAKQPDIEPQAEREKPQDTELQQSDGKQYRLFEGTVFETVLTNRLNGSFTGPVNVMLTADVYSHDHQRLLIPKGSRILGEAAKVSAVGQQRLAVSFHRVIMPDGFSLSLDKFLGMNQIGETGLRDQVNNHYAQLFGVSLALGAIAGMEQIGANYGTSAGGLDAYRLGTSQSLSQSAVRILDRFLNVLPTMTVCEGHRVKVYLTGDLHCPAYSAHRVPSDL
jgi:type IV secretion system protein VirB10